MLLAIAALAGPLTPQAGADGGPVFASYALVGVHKRAPGAHRHGRCAAAGHTRARHKRAHRACRGVRRRASRHVRLLDHGSAPRSHRRSLAPASTRPDTAPATIATILATPCSETEITPEAQNLTAVREAVLCLINRERAAHGEQPLRTSAKLQQAAESHSRECVEEDYFAHISPSGETPVQRIEATGYVPSPLDGYVLGENLAWGTYELGSPQAIVAAWIASPEHLANILEASYTETGIGVSPAVPRSRGEGAQGATYAQEFGVIVR